MKFGKQLQRSEIPEWSRNYILYKKLKKCLAMIADDPQQEDLVTEFFYLLDRELQKVNAFYVYKMQEVERKLRIFEERFRILSQNSTDAVPFTYYDESTIDAFHRSLLESVAQIEKLIDYIKLNREGFRKILKKFDKRTNRKESDSYMKAKVSVQPFYTGIDEFELIHDRFQALVTGLRSFLNDNAETHRVRRSISETSSSSQAHDFFQSLREYDVDGAVDILRSGLDITSLNDINGRTILHILVICGGDLNNSVSKNNEFRGSLSRMSLNDSSFQNSGVVLSERKDVVSTLLEGFEGIRKLVFATDMFGRIPLHYAAIDGNQNLARQLIQVSSSSYEAFWVDGEGHSPLFYAISNGHTGVVTEILKIDGVNVNDLFKGPSLEPSSVSLSLTPVTPVNPGASILPHFSPLALACRYGHDKIVKLLIENGADPNISDEDGETPLHYCAKNGFANCMRLLLTMYGNENIPEKNLYRIDTEIKDYLYQWTPIFLAATEGNTYCIELLIEHGAKVVLTDTNGWTPLEHAVFRGHLEAAKKIKPFFQNKSANLEGNDISPVGRSRVNDSFTSMFYGHKYLVAQCMIMINLGFNDLRNLSPPVEFEDKNFIAYQSVSLIVTAINGVGEPAILDLPVKNFTDPVIFFTNQGNVDVNNIRIRFDLVPTYGSEKRSFVGTSVASLDSISRQAKTAVNRISSPILNEEFDVIGKINFELLVVKPFQHEGISIGSKQTYWKSIETKVIGHRGAGANNETVSNLQVNENTVLSMITGASLGAEYVEFDVQLTRDHVPVIYHDWILSETGLHIPVNAISLKEFESLGHRSLKKAKSRGRMSRHNSRSLSDDDSSKSDIFDNIEALNHRRHHGGRADKAIKAPFATLKSAFSLVPIHTGFNIEVKFPTEMEADKDGLSIIEINDFVDKILECVFEHAKERSIIFSSFHPETCLLLNLKQPNYPVFFLTRGGTESECDIRCSSIQEAIRFAKFSDLLGIVSVSDPIIEAPKLCNVIKESGLLLFTYGKMNNDVKNVSIQKKHGVDAVIVDNILPIASGLKSSVTAS